VSVVREIRMLRSMWRGLETWLDRNNSIEVGAPVLDPTEDVTLEHWQTVGPGGQARYASAAIQTCLMLRAAFKLPLRQTEGLIASVLTLMGLTISTPDHSTVSRRAVTLPVVQPASLPHGALHVLIDSTGLQVYGAGQWLEAKHGAKSRRKWRKLHLAVDAASGMIVAQTLTDQDADDPSQVAPLLDQIDGPIGRVMADGAYDGAPTYRTIAAHGDDIEVVIPLRSTAVPGANPVRPHSGIAT
jgi:Transposase DDE domain